MDLNRVLYKSENAVTNIQTQKHEQCDERFGVWRTNEEKKEISQYGSYFV